MSKYLLIGTTLFWFYVIVTQMIKKKKRRQKLYPNSGFQNQDKKTITVPNTMTTYKIISTYVFNQPLIENRPE